MHSRSSDVCFTSESRHRSGRCYVRFVPKADIGTFVSNWRIQSCQVRFAPKTGSTAYMPGRRLGTRKRPTALQHLTQGLPPTCHASTARFKNGAARTQPRHVNDSKQCAIAQSRGALMPTMSATRWLPARCHLTCTTVPTLTSHHEPCATPTTNRVLSVTWYVQARRLRTAVKVRAASSRAVTVPPPLGDP
jgi:hypothetical protein